MEKKYKIWVFFLLGMLMLACAKPLSPSGGPRDTSSPVLLPDSEPNFQTNFSKKKIDLKFDEFIKLQNATKEVLISPPTTYLPEFKTRTNTLSIVFNDDEVFKENTTYQINFGNAISDFNENNKLENFTFIFATGDKIDSLALEGTVVDLLEGKPEENMLVMVYDDLQDSVVYLQKPSYFARTDKNGAFKITNMRSDTFKVFALMDANLNFLYDNPNEKIAHVDTTLLLTDSIQYNITMKAYFERQPQGILAADGKNPGIIKCALINEKPIPEFELLNDSITYTTCAHSDSLYIYYKPIQANKFQMVSAQDTFKISHRLRDTSKLTITNQSKLIEIHPEESMTLSFSQCLNFTTDSLISLTDTSGTDIAFETLINEKGELEINGNVLDTTDYLLTIYPKAVSSFIQSNQDTITQNVRSGSEDQFGNIIIVSDSLDISKTYIFNLIKGEQKLNSVTVEGHSRDSLNFKNLLPGSYTLEVIEDLNKDQMWTAGTYLTGEKSERKVSKALENLKKGWDVNVNFEVNSLDNQ